MGNAHCHVINDSKEKILIASYNTSDMANWTPHLSYTLEPGQTIKIKALPDWRGLRLEAQYGTGKSGLFNATNGAEVKVSDILLAVGGSIPEGVVTALINGTASVASAAIGKL